MIKWFIQTFKELGYIFICGICYVLYRVFKNTIDKTVIPYLHSIVKKKSKKLFKFFKKNVFFTSIKIILLPIFLIFVIGYLVNTMKNFENRQQMIGRDLRNIKEEIYGIKIYTKNTMKEMTEKVENKIDKSTLKIIVTIQNLYQSIKSIKTENQQIKLQLDNINNSINDLNKTLLSDKKELYNLYRQHIDNYSPMDEVDRNILLGIITTNEFVETQREEKYKETRSYFIKAQENLGFLEQLFGSQRKDLITKYIDYIERNYKQYQD